MWQAVPIEENMYGLQPEENRHESWAATAQIAQRNGQMVLDADIHLSYVSNQEEYEALLDTIRYLAEVYQHRSDQAIASIHYRCKGAIHFPQDSLPVREHQGGHSIVDAEFSEELISYP